jgi:hypothetical protein
VSQRQPLEERTAQKERHKNHRLKKFKARQKMRTYKAAWLRDCDRLVGDSLKRSNERIEQAEQRSQTEHDVKPIDVRTADGMFKADEVAHTPVVEDRNSRWPVTPEPDEPEEIIDLTEAEEYLNVGFLEFSIA